MTPEHRFVDVGGLRIHYLHDGDKGAPLVLLHGGGSDSASLSWGHLISPLATSYCVFAPDWPGYGESDRPDAEYSMPYYISVLGRFIDSTRLVRPSLVGISMGGAVALGFTLSHPEAVKKLVLVDSYGLQDRAPAHKLSYLFVRAPLVNELTWASLARSRSMARASLQGLFHNPGSLTEELFDAVFAELNKPRAGAAFRSFQRNELRWDGTNTVYMDQLDKVRAPTLIVHGADDGLVPLRFARQAHALLPGSQLRVISNAGHWVQREQPQEFLEAITAFLKE